MWLLLTKVQEFQHTANRTGTQPHFPKLPCVQWAYLLRVLLDFKPSTSFLRSYCICKISTSRLIAQFSVFVEAVSLTGPGYQSAQARR